MDEKSAYNLTKKEQTDLLKNLGVKDIPALEKGRVALIVKLTETKEVLHEDFKPTEPVIVIPKKESRSCVYNHEMSFARSDQDYDYWKCPVCKREEAVYIRV